MKKGAALMHKEHPDALREIPHPSLISPISERIQWVVFHNLLKVSWLAGTIVFGAPGRGSWICLGLIQDRTRAGVWQIEGK
jgi:hypothetical protein